MEWNGMDRKDPCCRCPCPCSCNCLLFSRCCNPFCSILIHFTRKKNITSQAQFDFRPLLQERKLFLSYSEKENGRETQNNKKVRKKSVGSGVLFQRSRRISSSPAQLKAKIAFISLRTDRISCSTNISFSMHTSITYICMSITYMYPPSFSHCEFPSPSFPFRSETLLFHSPNFLLPPMPRSSLCHL